MERRKGELILVRTPSIKTQGTYKNRLDRPSPSLRNDHNAPPVCGAARAELLDSILEGITRELPSRRRQNEQKTRRPDERGENRRARFMVKLSQHNLPQ